MKNLWDNEYSNPRFTSLSDEPHKGVKQFLRSLKKERGDLAGLGLLDIGCGIGKDVRYAVRHYGMRGVGIDVSSVAISEAMKRAEGSDGLEFHVASAGERFPVSDESVDVALCVMVFHVFSPKERELFLLELARVLKPGAQAYLKTFIFEGDSNAKNLMREFPGTEENSYIHPDLGVQERVFSEVFLRDFFGQQFEILLFQKEEGYQRWGNQSYKRKYGVLYLQKNK